MSQPVPPLVSTEWLASRLGTSGLVVADATYHLPNTGRDGRAEHLQAHLPGAVFFDVDGIKDASNPLPHMVPSADVFAAAMESLGIASTDHVVVYDAHGLMSAARAWWMLRLFGHDRVSILDGGLPKWRAENRAVESGPVSRSRSRFTATFRPALLRDRAQMLANLATRAEQVVDARSAGRFEGTAPEPRAGLRGGHIPGSRSLPYDRIVDPATKGPLPAARIAAAFLDAGIDPSRPVVCSCGSGVSAGVLAFGLFLAGHRDAAIYDGSWSEWGLPGDTPVDTGPAR
ncbi:MAG: 3-mercaptopyruvate sulfurtransferase [Alphaproteobacteria bacterium]|nr:3-mercaptopyruvate sulfurtransferase [Alphaproteobacteria bacterium]